jgi:hypothetical protein
MSKSKTVFLSSIALAALTLGIACGDGASSDASTDDVGKTMNGTDGNFTFDVHPHETPTVGENHFHVCVRDTKTEVLLGTASLTASAVMPSMGHSADGIEVSPHGDGCFTVNEVWLSMAGTWELQLHANEGSRQDRALVRYDVR